MTIQTYYDVVVIGGGIHGAGVAQASAAQGYSVLLLEQNEIASGTSRKSSKLIHGGLRYLESGQFSLVHECLQERRYLLKNAPHLVEMKPFFIPVYQQTSRRPWKIFAGLSLYAALAGFRKKTTFHRVSKENWDKLDGLCTENLQTVFQYWDAQTNDQLLTKAVVESAKNLGAEVLEHTALDSAEYDSNQWQVSFKHGNSQLNVNAGVIVNAAGPWVNQVLQQILPRDVGMAVDLVQGTHIVLDKELFQGMYYLESPMDQRAVFVMPWYGQALIGTTEKIYQGDPSAVAPTIEEEKYLQETVGHYFPDMANMKIDRSFAGLRVLPRQSGAAFSRPRETTILNHKTQACFSIYGGKLTAYRATSERVVERFADVLPARKAIADTRNLVLPD